jgi:L-ribulokinase
MACYSIGLDFGTNSVRALIVNSADGSELATEVWEYRHGDSGVVLDTADSNVARHHPEDYIQGTEAVIRSALQAAANKGEFKAQDVIGIGIDTTGSTPMPVDKNVLPLALKQEFSGNKDAMAWLWKDHSAFKEAEEITRHAERERPEYLAKCGGTYSSEWFWAKILHCMRRDPEVTDAAYTWIEIADWVPAMLCGITDASRVKRGICPAGHKAMFNPGWGGYPDAEFLSGIDPKLAALRKTLPDRASTIADSAGTLSKEWAEKTGLREGIPVSVGAFDAHTGGVGSGIRPGVMVKNLGTSTCDMMVVPLDEDLADIPGLCGIVPESILPGYYGLEAGQSAVGDIFNWFVNYIKPGGEKTGSHQALTEEAAELRPGESGLLCLDWHNGNRTVLIDQRLTGLIIGLTLHSTPGEIYRTLIEGTAFGARVIMERFEEYGQTVEEIINCGGISVKNPLVMQIYADIMERPLKISKSSQTGALGSAMAGSVIAGKSAGGWDSFGEAAAAMTGTMDKEFIPIPENVAVYKELYRLYRELHDAFGIRGEKRDLSSVMKDLLDIKDRVRSGSSSQH